MLINVFQNKKEYPVSTTKESCSKRILCIEDDIDTCEMLSFLLSEYDFVFVHNPQEAFPLIEGGGFDLYILDNWLPGMSGMEVCRRIRTVSSKTPILFTSAVSSRDEIQKALEAGADKYLIKPCEPDEILKVVKELIYKN
jgi:DNA-binding response OmpR family regulator